MQDLSPTKTQSAPPIRILLIEDDAGDAYLVRDQLETGPDAHELTWVRDMAEAGRTLDSTFDCALLDLGLPDSQGLDALHTLLDLNPGLAVVVLTGLDDQHRGALALEQGAQDYLTKGSVTEETLARSLRYAIARQRGEDATQRLREAELSRAELETRAGTLGAAHPARRHRQLGDALSTRREQGPVGRRLLRRH